MMFVFRSCPRPPNPRGYDRMDPHRTTDPTVPIVFCRRRVDPSLTVGSIGGSNCAAMAAQDDHDGQDGGKGFATCIPFFLFFLTNTRSVLFSSNHLLRFSLRRQTTPLRLRRRRLLLVRIAVAQFRLHARPLTTVKQRLRTVCNVRQDHPTCQGAVRRCDPRSVVLRAVDDRPQRRL